MCKGFSKQIVVDKGRDCTNAPKTKPHENKSGGVQEVHGNDLLGLDTMHSSKPVPITQNSFVSFTECPSTSLVYNERMVGHLGIIGILFEGIEKIQTVGSLFKGRIYKQRNKCLSKIYVIGNRPSCIKVRQSRRSRRGSNLDRNA